MIFARRLSCAALVCAVMLTPMLALAAPKKAPKAEPTFKGAIVTDAATGNVLLEQNADVVTPPASMTKLMTFAVLSDKLKSGALTLGTVVQIEPEDARMGGTQVFLDPRESFTVEELIYAMMIQSANDASYALARVSAGSVPAFVELMNAKARELGMTQTTFRSPHGLPPKSRRVSEGDLTTPRDFSRLCRHLLLNTDVLKYSSVKHRVFGPQRATPQQMKNHNNLLGKVAGVDGLKTGYTEGAGYCLSATALRNDRRVIVVIMGAFGPNGQKDLGRSRDRKTIELLERGFAALPANSPAFTGPAAPPPSPISHAPMSADEQETDEETGEPVIKFSIPPAKK
ncbi:D-alanyl-D-alanine carboxypeptidase family protein [Opitutus terrae]|uniref:Serine-type D-Ala-D-Ala carboxypeptidase n=1 Tax=Opitutus terrae (strain DSM 11246 / JCM 15787 / PB90-1) TaxID=452637 RepID=B1ZV09_OPITP|nr:D-alanyl-D-alanine carboxypeptidase family protein [Opitutus terrae]ACB75979.1 Serine-type D-Ala-D-Ala carboxypeptidase [Opitutus terrae PB90-1]